ncbi:MAG: hypothetical protein K2O05_02300, partial [Anaeroplasmataceae bacterium]|nr:hypothetical protein [Anaeroplasmataceae bacterium]
IIHVVDSSSPYLNQQLNVVMDVLAYLKVQNIPMLFLLNKWDQTLDNSMQILGYPSMPFSNKTKLNVENLCKEILTNVGPSTIRAKLFIPYKEGKLSHILEESAQIYQKEYQNNGILYEVEIPIKLYSKFHDYDLDAMVS